MGEGERAKEVEKKRRGKEGERGRRKKEKRGERGVWKGEGQEREILFN